VVRLDRPLAPRPAEARGDQRCHPERAQRVSRHPERAQRVSRHPERAQRGSRHPERAQRGSRHPERAQRVEGSAPLRVSA